MKTKIKPLLEGLWAIRKYLMAGWVLGVVAFTVFRVVIVWNTLVAYDVSVFWFAVIDLVTAVPYAFAVPYTVLALVRKQTGPFLVWSGVWVICFLAPYLYTFAVAKYMPHHVTLIIIAWLLVFGCVALLRAKKLFRNPGSADAAIAKLTIHPPRSEELSHD